MNDCWPIDTGPDQTLIISLISVIDWICGGPSSWIGTLRCRQDRWSSSKEDITIVRMLSLGIAIEGREAVD